MLRSTLPLGYRQASSATGLLVPEDTPRAREVFTKDEARLLERAMKLIKARGLVLQMRCSDERCQDTKIERIVDEAGDVRLRCAHRDLVFSHTL
jgi:hypothetical protein